MPLQKLTVTAEDNKKAAKCLRVKSKRLHSVYSKTIRCNVQHAEIKGVLNAINSEKNNIVLIIKSEPNVSDKKNSEPKISDEKEKNYSSVVGFQTNNKLGGKKIYFPNLKPEKYVKKMVEGRQKLGAIAFAVNCSVKHYSPQLSL